MNGLHVQAPASFVDAAVKSALHSLRNRGLLSFRALPGDEKPKWRATAMGKAVHSSSLPTHLGERLYKVTPCMWLALSAHYQRHAIWDNPAAVHGCPPTL